MRKLGNDDKPPSGAELRLAMLSVYYHSIGRQFQISGAPSVMLPPQVQPLTLEKALDLMSGSPRRLREAIWRIVQSVPCNVPEGIEAYPHAIRDYFTDPELQTLNDRRRWYRAGANVFAAALVACRDGADQLFRQIMTVIGEADSADVKFDAVWAVLGESRADYLKRIVDAMDHADDDEGKKISSYRRQINKIETEVGVNIYDFVENMADVAAFQDVDLGLQWNPGGDQTAVFPMCSIIRQNSSNLTTTASVTTIVYGDFERLADCIDPRNWARSSDVIMKSNYVRGPYDDRRPVADDEYVLTSGVQRQLFMDEYARVSWGGDSDQEGTFHNILNIETKYRYDKNHQEDAYADVDYSLCRSIDSKILWDERKGGLLVNQGFIKIRPLGKNRWRVSMKKEVRFSDRTPYANAAGWADFGQLVNYFAPAVMTWWLECETYSLADIGQHTPCDDSANGRHPSWYAAAIAELLALANTGDCCGAAARCEEAGQR